MYPTAIPTTFPVPTLTGASGITEAQAADLIVIGWNLQTALYMLVYLLAFFALCLAAYAVVRLLWHLIYRPLLGLMERR